MNSYSSHFRETIRLAYPVSIGQLGHISLGVADSIMVGKVGAVPLAASSLVNGLVFLIVVFGLGMTMAITPLVAIAKGKDDESECGVVLRQALLVNLVFGILIVGLIFILSALLPYLNQPPLVTSAAISYTRIIAVSILPFILFQVYRQFIEGLSFTRPAMYIVLAANLVNVFGNWLFIYGNWGFPALGLNGAGYSTFFTRSFMGIVMAVYVMKAPRFRSYDPGLRFRGLHPAVIRRVIRLGLPMGFQHFFEVGAFAFSAVMIGWLGSKALAAHQIALSLASVSFMIVLGIASAGTIRVGQYVGRGYKTEVRHAGFSAIMLSAAVMALFGLIFILLRHRLPYIFISDPTVITVAASLLVVAALFQMSDGIQAAGIGVLRGITDVEVPTVISFVAYWVIGLPVGYLMGFTFGYGVVGIWIGFLCGLSVAALFFCIRFHLKTRLV